MKALVLAGGYATRLRPLSFSKPKLLFPLLGKPLLERTIETLDSLGVDEVILAVNYLADLLKKHFGKKYQGVSIHYSLEEEALGTAGPLKRAEKQLKGEDCFFTLNGDVLFDPQVREMVKDHGMKGGLATIALHEVNDPSRFGVAVFDDEMRIKRFVEKPRPGDIDSRWINAGIYLLSPEVLEYIPSGKKVSMEAEVFPKLAQEEVLFGFKYHGEWYDIGKIEDYVSANYHILRRSGGGPLIQGGSTIPEDAVLKPPLMIGGQSIIGGGCKIGPYAILGEQTILGRNVRVEDSILFKSVRIGCGSQVLGCLLGDEVEVGEGVKIDRGVVVGDRVKVRSGVRITGGVKICPFKEVSSDILTPSIIL